MKKNKEDWIKENEKDWRAIKGIDRRIKIFEKIGITLLIIGLTIFIWALLY